MKTVEVIFSDPQYNYITEARAVLEAIPPDQWSQDNRGCALSHLFKHYYPKKDSCNLVRVMCEEKEMEYFYQQTKEYMLTKETNSQSIIGVNDNSCLVYPQGNPKDRVMMLLSDMIAAGYE